MTIRDLREIAKWTVVTAIVASCVAVGTSAVSVAPVTPVQVTESNKIADCELKASVHKAIRPDQVRVVIQAANTKPAARLLALDVSIVRTEFTADPLSRTIGPNDTKTEVESVKRVAKVVPASGKATMELVMPLRAVAPAAPKLDVSNGAMLAANGNTLDVSSVIRMAGPATVSYEVTASQGNTKVRLASFTRETLGSK